MNKLTLGIVAAIFSTSVSAGWSIKGLGTMGGYSSMATSINESGQVVGTYTTTDFEIYSFYTSLDGSSIFDLGTLGGPRNAAEGINDYGQIAGGSYLPNTTTLHAYLTDRNGANITDLGGGEISYAMGLNNSGVVVGQATFGNPNVHSFITGPNGVGITDMGTLGGTSSSALAVNESGQVVGWSDTINSTINSTNSPVPVHHAFITGPNGVGMTDLGTLNGSIYAYSMATDINESGQVVGQTAVKSTSNSHPFITGPDGVGMIDLGALGGSSGYGIATAINDYGQVVGWSDPPGSSNHGFIYSDGIMVDLTLLEPFVSAGWTRIIPLDINNAGQIVGEGVHNGVLQAFIISGANDSDFYKNYIPPTYEITPPPIPEPSTYLMLLAGLGLLGFMRKNAA